MTDELTPEEQEALKNLPRERMPIGLEARVVEAMREHGFLAKRRRAIEITNSRVAGLLAASVALMIGAYSIGLNRGGGEQVLPGVAPMERDDHVRAVEPAVGTPEKKVEAPASSAALEAERPAREKARETERTPESKPATAATPGDVPVARSDEAKADGARNADAVRQGLVKTGEELHARAGREAPAAQVMAKESTGPQAAAPTVATKQPLTFLLNGVPVTVEADSVRVVETDRGRTLIIYTSDGVFRIPLADDD